MSTQDKKIKVVSTADFDNNKIINATIDASENEVIGVGKIDDVLVNGTSVVENKIANVEVPTKVSDLENDSGYTTVADINSEIIANSSFMDNELKEGSFNAVMNDAITKGIEKNKVSVVDSFVDTLPSETLTLGQSVLNKTDNKIYKVVGEKQIEDYYFKINGSLSINNDDGCITGFSEENYISFADDVIEYTNPVWSNIKVNKLIFTLAPAYSAYTTTIFSIIRRDDNSVLFGVDYTSGYGGRLDIYTKKRDGTKVDSYTIYAAVTNSRYELEITNSCYVKILDRGKTIAIKYFGSLEPSTEVGDDFYYNIPADIKISSKKITSQQYTYTVGIQKLYGLESNITYQSGGMPSGGDIVYFSDNGVWNNGTELFSGKLVYNTANYGLYEYNGTNMVPLIPDMKLYQKKLAAGNNITLSPEGYQNFSNSNYLSFNSTVDSTYSDDLFFKVTINETNRLNTLLYSSFDTDKYGYIEITDENKLSCGWSSGSSIITFIGANYVFQPNKTYWIRLVQNRVPQQFYILEDNNYTIETVPKDRSVWTADARNPSYSFIVKLYANSTNYLGYLPSAPEYYFKGAIAEFSVGNIFTLSTATEGVDFTNHGCVKGPVISAVVPEIDSQLSDVSENPVQNRVIDSALKAMKPITVTDSGNALPSTSGYVLHDTFLNTTDKKIYGTLANAYELNDNSQISTNNATPVVIDYVTGITNNFSFNFNVNQYSYSYLTRIGVSSDSFRWVGDRDYRVHFKITSQGTTNAKYMLFGISHGIAYGSNYIVGVFIQDSKLYINEISSGMGGVSLTVSPVELINYTLEMNKEYYLRLLKKSNGEVETVIYEDRYDQTILARNTVSPQINDITTSYGDNPVSLYFGGYWRGSNNDWGYGFNGDIYLLDSMGEFLKPASQLIWDNGTPIINLTSYLDKTNSLLYYYESPDLISIGGGISDYSDLTNKPSINNVTLSGNKTSSDLGLQSTLTWTYTEATETLEVE